MATADQIFLERPALYLRRPWVQLILALAVLLSHGWMLGLEFQLDDFEQVEDALKPLEPAVLMGQDTAAQIQERGHRSMVAFLRPVLHLSLALDVAIFGTSPFALHGMSLLWHLAVTLMLHRVLRRLLIQSRLEDRLQRIELWALIAAGLFAVHPGIWGATSWVAARGDVLATFFFLVALDQLISWRREPRVRALGFVFAALIAALFAKEGAVVAPVLLVVIDYGFLRHREAHLLPLRTWPTDLAMLILAPAYLLLRQQLFGEQAKFYAGYERLITWEIITRILGDIVPTFSMLVGGSFHEAGGALGTILRSFLTTALFLLPIPWLLRRPIRRTKFVALSFLLYLVAAAAPLRFYEEASGFDASRLFYLPFVFIAPLLALPFLTLESPFGLIRRLGLAFSLLAGLTWGLAAISHVKAQWAASEIIAQVRSDLLAISSEPGGDQVYYAVIGVPSDVDHAPTYGTFLGRAFSSAFMKQPIALMSIQKENRAASLRNRMLTNPDHRVPVQILEWVEDDEHRGRLVKLSGILPPPGGPRPRVDLSAGQTSHDFVERLRPRDVECFAIDFAVAPTEPFSAELRFESDHDAAFSYRLNLKPNEFGAATRHYVEVVENEAWLFSQAIKTCKWTLTSGSAPQLEALDFAVSLPEILLVESAERSLKDRDPGIRFVDPGSFDWFRIRVFLQGETRSFTYPRTRFAQHEGGVLGIHLDSPGFLPGENPLPLAELQAQPVNILDLKGIRGLPLSYRVEALRGDISAESSAQAASKIGRVMIGR